MQTDDPPFLTVGTEVSAKFKGAFCEAKIKKVNKNIKVKVLLKEHPYRSQFVMLEDLPKETKLEINEIVQVLDASKTYMMRAVIQGFKDCSRYHVVFNDGDEKELRRTQVCLKGGKHFDAAVNLDAMPLTNPEQFSSPVLKNSGKKRGGFVKKRKDESPPSKSSRKRDDDDEDDDEEDEVEEGTKKREKRAAASAATAAISEAREGNETQSDDDSEADSSEEKERGREKKKQREEEREKEKERERLEKEEERKLEKAKKKQIRMNLKNIRIEQREQMKQQREIEREKKRLEKEQQKERRRREMKEKELRKASEGKKRKSFDADRSGEDVDYLPRKKTSKSQAQSISKEDVDLAEERIKNVVGKHRMTKKFVYTMRKAYAKSKKDIELEEDEEDDDPNVPSTSKQTKKSKHELLDESDEESDDDDDKKRVKIKELGELMFSKKRKQFEKLREIYQQLDPALQKKFKKKTKLISNYKHLRKRGRWSHHIKFTDRKNRTAKRKVQLERLSPGSIGVRFGDEKVPDKVRQLMRKQAEVKQITPKEEETDDEGNYTARCNPKIYGLFYKKLWHPVMITSWKAFKNYSGEEIPRKGFIPVRDMVDGKYLLVRCGHVIPFEWTPKFTKKKWNELVAKHPVDHQHNLVYAIRQALTKMYQEPGFEASSIYGHEKYIIDRFEVREVPRLMLELKSSKKESRRSEEPVHIPRIDAFRSGSNYGNDDSDNIDSDEVEMKPGNFLNVQKEGEEDHSDDSIRNAPNDVRDAFYARLYNFHEDNGTPINSLPTFNEKPVDLYFLYQLIRKFGGLVRTKRQNPWPEFAQKMMPDAKEFEEIVELSFNTYLSSFCAFEKKLGWSMISAEKKVVKKIEKEEVVVRPKRKYCRKNKPTKKAETESEEEEEEGSSLSNSDDDDYESTSKRGRRKQRDDDSESQQRDSEYRRTHDDSPYTSSGRKKRLVSESMGSDTSSVVGPDVKKGGKRGPKSSRNSVSFGRSPSHNDRERSVSTGKSGQRGRKKKDDSSFDEEEARRRSKLGRPKNERRPIASGSGTAVAQEADDEPYVECNVISRFYLGQKVRARYNTNWYDARVVDIRQSTVQDIIRIIAPCILEAELDREIVGQLQIKNKEFHIYVHYLGWNSRYDEWVEAEAVKISMKDQHQSRIQFREHSEDISSNLIACAETCLSEKVSFADTLKSVQETFATWEDRRLTNGLAEVSVASPARQSMSPSMLTSPEQVKYGLNERTEQIMKQMQHEPNATLRDVATATVGIASRDRGSRLLLSPPGGRSQKTLLHQVSTSAEAGLQALRSSERKSEGPSTSAGSSDAGNQNASSSIPSSSAIVLSPALSLARSGPLTLDLPSTSAAATKVSSLVKNRGARSVSPNDVYYGDNYDDYDKEEEDSDDMEDMEDEDQKKSIDDDENEDQEMKEESKSPVPLDSDEDEKMDVDDVKSPDRSGTKTPVDYDSTRKSTRQSTVASSTASINAQKAITSIVQSSPLNQSGPLTFSPEPVKSTPQRGRRRKSPELDNRMEVEETKEVVTDEDKEDTDEQKSEGTAEDSSVASRKPRTPDDSVLSVDATLQDKEDEDDKSGKSSTPFDAPDFPSPRGLQPGRGKRKKLGRPPGPNAKQPKLMTPPVKKTSEKGDDSQDDLDEDEAPTTPTSSRDTFHTLKTRMYKLMEHENSLNDYSILGFADLDEEMSGLADEELNEFLENRAYELRDIYTTAKSEVVQMEKKKRRFMEKGKSDKPNSVPTKKNLTPKSNGSSTGVPRNLRASSADRKANTNGIKPERSFEV